MQAPGPKVVILVLSLKRICGYQPDVFTIGLYSSCLPYLFLKVSPYNLNYK